MKTKINKITLSLISLCLFLWLAGIILAPVVAVSNIKPFSFLSSVLYFFYQPVCHQLTERSFFINNIPMAVCVRCFAVYLGGWVLSIYYLRSKKITLWPLKRYVVLLMPFLVDLIFEKLQLYADIDLVRFITGFLLGIVIFQIFFLSIVSIDLRSLARSVKIYLHNLSKNL
jgi:uncharacterized membrane protein